MKIALLVLFVFTFVAFAQAPAPTETSKPDGPPKVSVEDHDKLNDLEKQSLQIYIQKENIQRKYDQQRDADPEWQNLTRQESTVTQQLTSEFQRVQTQLDPTQARWKLNPSTLQVEPVRPAGPTPVTPNTEKK